MKKKSKENFLTDEEIRRLNVGRFYQKFKSNNYELRGRTMLIVPHGRFARWQLLKIAVIPELHIDRRLYAPTNGTPRTIVVRPRRYRMTRGRDGVLILENKHELIMLMPYSHSDAGLLDITRLEVDWPV